MSVNPTDKTDVQFEEEAIIRHIDRDMDYKSELISLKEDFWFNNVQAQVPPPYFEDDGGSYTVTFNPSYKESILKDNLLRLKSADLMIPEDARSPYTFGDHPIRFTAVGYGLPQTDSIKMELEGAWTKGKYGCQLQIDRWHEIVPPPLRASGAICPPVC